MYKSKKIWILLLIIGGYAGCTVDDICSEETPTTPRVVISFADNRIADLGKPLEHLKVRSIEYDTLVWDAPADTIMIPLSTEENSVSYAFTIQKNNIEYTNIFKFDYQREEVYVNRACGYKMFFNELEAYDTSNEDNHPIWAKNITVLNPTVQDEKESHITILH